MNSVWKKANLTVVLHDEVTDKPVKKSFTNVQEAYSAEKINNFADGLVTLTGLALDHVEVTDVTTIA